MDPESGILSESVLFEARKATSPSSFPSYYSSRIRRKMREIEKGMSEKDAEIEASKTHWTEVASNFYYTPPASGSMESSTSKAGGESCPPTSGGKESSTSETGGESSEVTGESSGETGGESCGVEMTEEEWAELYKKNVEEMWRLKMEDLASDFFRIGGKVTGEMIAKGGQATIYEHWMDDEDHGLVSTVLKVFDAGYFVRELRKQWPLDLLQCGEWREANVKGVRNPIFMGSLMDDGRFAFEMFRLWGDVRKLLDVRMQHNGNRYPPFMTEDGSYHEFWIFMIWLQIAEGMYGLHDQDTLHRDLKASNVLIESIGYLQGFKEENRFNPIEFDVSTVSCFVADYECSIGVVGTTYWIAPEILKAVKNRTLDSSNVFTWKADVYSYAMTCYEIMTGFVPFEHPEDEGTDVDLVLQGKRPTLPQHLKLWVREMFQICWHVDPLVRPTFLELITILKTGIGEDPIFGIDQHEYLCNFT